MGVSQSTVYELPVYGIDYNVREKELHIAVSYSRSKEEEENFVDEETSNRDARDVRLILGREIFCQTATSADYLHSLGTSKDSLLPHKHLDFLQKLGPSSKDLLNEAVAKVTGAKEYQLEERRAEAVALLRSYLELKLDADKETAPDEESSSSSSSSSSINVGGSSSRRGVFLTPLAFIAGEGGEDVSPQSSTDALFAIGLGTLVKTLSDSIRLNQDQSTTLAETAFVSLLSELEHVVPLLSPIRGEEESPEARSTTRPVLETGERKQPSEKKGADSSATQTRSSTSTVGGGGGTAITSFSRDLSCDEIFVEWSGNNTLARIQPNAYSMGLQSNEYPVVMSKAFGAMERNCISVLLVGPVSDSLVSFGMATRDIAASSECGFGSHSGKSISWGLQQKSEQPGGEIVVALVEKGTVTGKFGRKLVAGDVVSVVSDLTEGQGWVEVLLNMGEYRHRFHLSEEDLGREMVLGGMLSSENKYQLLPLPYASFEQRKPITAPATYSSVASSSSSLSLGPGGASYWPLQMLLEIARPKENIISAFTSPTPLLQPPLAFARPNICLSVFFGIAVVRQSLVDMLEIVQLLAEPHLVIQPIAAKRFLSFFFNDEKKQVPLEASEQATEIMRRLGQIAIASEGTCYPIVCDFELNFLLEMIERGAEAAASGGGGGSGSVGGGGGGGDVERDISLGSFALQILFHNLSRLHDDMSEDEGADPASLLNLPFPSPSVSTSLASLSAPPSQQLSSVLTYGEKLSRVLHRIVENANLDPETSQLGFYAVKMLAHTLFLPSGSKQFAVVSTLMEKTQAGLSTLCERQLLVHQFDNFHVALLLKSSVQEAQSIELSSEFIPPSGFASTAVMIDGLPIVQEEKAQKLKTVLCDRVLRRIIPTIEESSLDMPLNSSKGTVGFCIVKLQSVKDANTAVSALQGFRFDSKHTFRACLCSDLQGKGEAMIFSASLMGSAERILLSKCKLIGDEGTTERAAGVSVPFAEETKAESEHLSEEKTADETESKAAVLVSRSAQEARQFELETDLQQSVLTTLDTMSTLLVCELFRSAICTRKLELAEKSRQKRLVSTGSSAVQEPPSRKVVDKLLTFLKSNLASLQTLANIIEDKLASLPSVLFSPPPLGGGGGGGGRGEVQELDAVARQVIGKLLEEIENSHVHVLLRSLLIFETVWIDMSTHKLDALAKGFIEQLFEPFMVLSRSVQRLFSIQNRFLSSEGDKKARAAAAAISRLNSSTKTPRSPPSGSDVGGVLVTVHPHPLITGHRSQPNSPGWKCDGMMLPGGCKRGCTDFTDTSSWMCYSCPQCDFDFCDQCKDAYSASSPPPNPPPPVPIVPFEGVSWIRKLNSSLLSIQSLIVKQLIEFTEEQDKYELCSQWLSSPLFAQGIINPLLSKGTVNLPVEAQFDGGEEEEEEDQEEHKHLVQEFTLLKKLTDASDGADESYNFVLLMKKLVRKDRTGTLGSSHVAHAAAAASIWHCGFSRSVDEMVQGLGEETPNVVPSSELKSVWSNVQDLREVFQNIEETDPEGENDSPRSSSLPSPPRKMNSLKVGRGGDADGTPVGGAGVDDLDRDEHQQQQTLQVAALGRQFSLPVQSGLKALHSSSLAAVRRARLLLSFHPMARIASSTEVVKQTNQATTGLTLYNFILSGPDADSMREAAMERKIICERRKESFDLIVQLFVLYGRDSLDERTSLLQQVAASLRRLCIEPKSKTPVSEPVINTAGGGAVEVAARNFDDEEIAPSAEVPPAAVEAETSSAPSSSPDEFPRLQQVHYSVNTLGALSSTQKAVLTSWFKFVEVVLEQGLLWLQELDAAPPASFKADKLASTLLAIFAVVTLDYTERDISSIQKSTLLSFIGKSLCSSDFSVRQAARILYEKVFHLSCKIIESARQKHEEAILGSFNARSSKAKQVLSKLLECGASLVQDHVREHASVISSQTFADSARGAEACEIITIPLPMNVLIAAVAGSGVDGEEATDDEEEAAMAGSSDEWSDFETDRALILDQMPLADSNKINSLHKTLCKFISKEYGLSSLKERHLKAGYSKQGRSFGFSVVLFDNKFDVALVRSSLSTLLRASTSDSIDDTLRAIVPYVYAEFMYLKSPPSTTPFVSMSSISGLVLASLVTSDNIEEGSMVFLPATIPTQLSTSPSPLKSSGSSEYMGYALSMWVYFDLHTTFGEKGSFLERGFTPSPLPTLCPSSASCTGAVASFDRPWSTLRFSIEQSSIKVDISDEGLSTFTLTTPPVSNLSSKWIFFGMSVDLEQQTISLFVNGAVVAVKALTNTLARSAKSISYVAPGLPFKRIPSSVDAATEVERASGWSSEPFRIGGGNDAKKAATVALKNLCFFFTPLFETHFRALAIQTLPEVDKKVQREGVAELSPSPLRYEITSKGMRCWNTSRETKFAAIPVSVISPLLSASYCTEMRLLYEADEPQGIRHRHSLRVSCYAEPLLATASSSSSSSSFSSSTSSTSSVKESDKLAIFCSYCEEQIQEGLESRCVESRCSRCFEICEMDCFQLTPASTVFNLSSVCSGDVVTVRIKCKDGVNVKVHMQQERAHQIASKTCFESVTEQKNFLIGDPSEKGKDKDKERDKKKKEAQSSKKRTSTGTSSNAKDAKDDTLDISKRNVHDLKLFVRIAAGQAVTLLDCDACDWQDSCGKFDPGTESIEALSSTSPPLAAPLTSSSSPLVVEEEEWECSICTAKNSCELEICNICEHGEKPATAMAQEGEAVEAAAAEVPVQEEDFAQSGAWACPICTVLNDVALAKCHLCGEGDRPPQKAPEGTTAPASVAAAGGEGGGQVSQKKSKSSSSSKSGNSSSSEHRQPGKSASKSAVLLHQIIRRKLRNRSVCSWDIWSCLSAPACLSAMSGLSRLDLIAFLAVLTRIGKALVVVGRKEEENEGEALSSAFFKYFGASLFSLAFRAPSANLRLAATKILCLFLATSSPAEVTEILTSRGYLSSSGDFLSASIQLLGCLSNPRAIVGPGNKWLNVACFHRSMLAHQIKLLLQAAVSSSQPRWLEGLQQAVTEALPKVAKELSELQGEQMTGHESFDTLMGLFTFLSPESLPGVNFFPGALVSFLGKEYTFVCFDKTGEASERSDGSVLMFPLRPFLHSVQRESEPESRTTYLQAGDISKLRGLHYQLPLSSLLSSSSFEELFCILSNILKKCSTTDPRPLPAFLRKHDTTLALDRNDFIYESAHPYPGNLRDLTEIQIPGAKELVVLFFPESETKSSRDKIEFFKDSSKSSSRQWGTTYSGPSSKWPGIGQNPPLIIKASSFFLSFQTEAQLSDEGRMFGFKILVSARPDTTSIPRPLRSPNTLQHTQVLLLRMVKAMAAKLATQLFSSTRDASDYQQALSLSDVQRGDAALWRSLLKSLLEHAVANALAASENVDCGGVLAGAEEAFSAKIGGVTRPSSSIRLLLQTVIRSRSLHNLPLKPSTLLSSDHKHDSFFALVMTALDPSSTSSPAPSTLKLETASLSSETFESGKGRSSAPSQVALSPVILASMTTTEMHPMFIPSSRCDVSANSSSKAFEGGSSGSGAAATNNGGADASFELEEQDDASSNEFFANGANLLNVSYPDNRVDMRPTAGFCSPLETSKPIPHTRASRMDYWESTLSLAMDAVANYNIYCLLSTVLEQWPAHIPFETTCGGEIHALLMVAGLGLHSPNASSEPIVHKNEVLVRAVSLSSSKQIQSPLLRALQSLFDKQLNNKSSGSGAMIETSPLVANTFSLCANIFTRVHQVQKDAGDAASKAAAEVDRSANQSALQPIVLETEHPYQRSSDTLVSAPGARGFEVIFDEQCETSFEPPDYIQLYPKASRQGTQIDKQHAYRGERDHVSRKWHGTRGSPSLFIFDLDEFYVYFEVRTSNPTSLWGWKLTAYPLVAKEQVAANSKAQHLLQFLMRGRSFSSPRRDDQSTFFQRTINLLPLSQQESTPSLGLALAAVSNILITLHVGEVNLVSELSDPSSTVARLVDFIFFTTQGECFLQGLVDTSLIVGQHYPVVFTSFLQLLTSLMGIYKALNSPSSPRMPSSRVDTLILKLSSRIIKLASLFSQFSEDVEVSGNPSILMQALSQASVVCFYASKDAAKNEDEAVVDNGSPSSPVHSREQYLGPCLQATNYGRGVCNISAMSATTPSSSLSPLPSPPTLPSLPSIALGPVFSDLSFPFPKEAIYSEHTCYLRVEDPGELGSSLSIGTMMLPQNGSTSPILSGRLGDIPGTSGWQLWEGRSELTFHQGVNANVCSFKGQSMGCVKGDILSVTLKANVQNNGSGWWVLEYCRNGMLLGTIMSTSDASLLDLPPGCLRYVVSSNTVSINVRKGASLNTDTTTVLQTGTEVDVLPGKYLLQEAPGRNSVRVRLLDGSGWTSITGEAKDRYLDFKCPTTGSLGDEEHTSVQVPFLSLTTVEGAQEARGGGGGEGGEGEGGEGGEEEGKAAAAAISSTNTAESTSEVVPVRFVMALAVNLPPGAHVSFLEEQDVPCALRSSLVTPSCTKFLKHPLPPPPAPHSKDDFSEYSRDFAYRPFKRFDTTISSSTSCIDISDGDTFARKKKEAPFGHALVRIAEEDSVTLTLDAKTCEAVGSGGNFSFGIAHGSFLQDPSNQFGLTKGSWGYVAQEKKAAILAQTRRVRDHPNLVDILQFCLRYERSQGKAWLYIFKNSEAIDPELEVEFIIHEPGLRDVVDLVIGCSLSSVVSATINLCTPPTRPEIDKVVLASYGPHDLQAYFSNKNCVACNIMGPSSATGDKECCACHLCSTCCSRGPFFCRRALLTTSSASSSGIGCLWLKHPLATSCLVARSASVTGMSPVLEDVQQKQLTKHTSATKKIIRDSCIESSVFEQVSGLHCSGPLRTKDFASIPALLKPIAVVYALLESLAQKAEVPTTGKVGGEDQSSFGGGGGGLREAEVVEEGDLIPSSLVYSLLIPLCMLKSVENHSIDVQNEETTRFSTNTQGAIAYAVRVLPSTALRPTSTLTVKMGTQGARSAPGAAQPLQINSELEHAFVFAGAGAASPVSCSSFNLEKETDMLACIAMLSNFSQRSDILFAQGPACLDEGFNDQTNLNDASYRFCQGDVVVRNEAHFANLAAVAATASASEGKTKVLAEPLVAPELGDVVSVDFVLQETKPPQEASAATVEAAAVVEAAAAVAPPVAPSLPEAPAQSTKEIEKRTTNMSKRKAQQSSEEDAGTVSVVFTFFDETIDTQRFSKRNTTVSDLFQYLDETAVNLIACKYTLSMPSRTLDPSDFRQLLALGDGRELALSVKRNEPPPPVPAPSASASASALSTSSGAAALDSSSPASTPESRPDNKKMQVVTVRWRASRQVDTFTFEVDTASSSASAESSSTPSSQKPTATLPLPLRLVAQSYWQTEDVRSQAAEVMEEEVEAPQPEQKYVDNGEGLEAVDIMEVIDSVRNYYKMRISRAQAIAALREFGDTFTASFSFNPQPEGEGRTGSGESGDGEDHEEEEDYHGDEHDDEDEEALNLLARHLEGGLAPAGGGGGGDATSATANPKKENGACGDEGENLLQVPRTLWSPILSSHVDITVNKSTGGAVAEGVEKEHVFVSIVPILSREACLTLPCFAPLRKRIATFANCARNRSSDANSDHLDEELVAFVSETKSDSSILTCTLRSLLPSNIKSLQEYPHIKAALCAERAFFEEMSLEMGSGFNLFTSSPSSPPSSAAIEGKAVEESKDEDVLEESKEDPVVAPAATAAAEKSEAAAAAAAAAREIADEAIDPRKSLLLVSRFDILQQLNASLYKCLDLIDLQGDSYNNNNNNSSSSSSSSNNASVLARMLIDARSLVFKFVKQELVTKSLLQSRNKVVVDKFTTLINRIDKNAHVLQGEEDVEGKWSVFGQAYHKLHPLPPSIFRTVEQLFEIKFDQEGGIDHGGLYRECFTEMVEELMASTLSENGKSTSVLPFFRPACVDSTLMVLNAATTTNAKHLDMLSFIGKLMGNAMRSKNYLDLNLCELAWKLLAKQEVSWHDYKEINPSLYSLVQDLRAKRLPKGESLGLYFVVNDSAGEIRELHEGGGEEAVIVGENDQRFCDELVSFKLAEMAPAARAIRVGMETQVPPAALALLTGVDLQRLVCGSGKVDISLLKQATHYSPPSIEKEAYISYFWQVLEQDFTESERKQLLKFVWSNPKLPLRLVDFTKRFNICAKPVEGHGNPDNVFPKSHTCHFKLELPAYSSRDVMRERLLIAISSAGKDFDKTIA